MNNKVSKKILSLALAVLLAVGMIPTATQAAGNASSNGAIIDFTELPEETANQTVVLGTAIEELSLPDSLTAAVQVAADIGTKEPEQEATPSEAALFLGEREFSEPQGGDEAKQTEMYFSVPVPEWTSNPEYDGETIGTYTFTPTLDGGWSLADDVEAPAITVEVVTEITSLNFAAVTLQASTGTMTIGGTPGYNLSDDQDGTGWSWITSTSTLILSSTYTGQEIDIQSAGTDTVYIEYSGDVTINGKLKSHGSMEINCTGIDADKLSVNNSSAAIISSGDLVIRSGTVSSTSMGNAAFHVSGSLSVLGSATIEALGGFFHGDLLCRNTITIDTTGEVSLRNSNPANYIGEGTLNYVKGTFQTGGTPAVEPSVSDVSDISMVADANVVRTFNLGAGYFEATGCTVSSNNPNIAAVSLNEDTITITGLNGGTATVTVTWVGGALAGQSKNIEVSVTAHPTIFITTHPTPPPFLTEGSISDSLSIEATVSDNGSPSYEWFSCDDTSYRNSATTNVTADIFPIPNTLTAGIYYYYCQVSAAGATSVRSNVATITVSIPPVNTYTISFNANGGTVANTSMQTGIDGKLVSLPLSTRSNHRFDGWFTASSGGSQISTNTVFTANDTVYAHWTYTGGSGSGSDHSDQSSKPVDTLTPAALFDQPTIGTVTEKVDGTTEQKTFTVTDSMVKSSLKKAQAKAKAQNRMAYGISVRIELDHPSASGLTVTLERSALNQLISGGAKHFELTGIPVGTIFDAKALAQLQKQGTGNVTLAIKPVTVNGVRNAYDIALSTVTDGKTVSITSLDTGSVNLSIPSTLGRNEAAGYLYAVYVDAEGQMNRIADSSYDSYTGNMIFATNHFSVYGVGYAAPSGKFTDTSMHWAAESIDYLAGKGLLSDTAETTFAPDEAITRGKLAEAIGRLAGLDVKAYTTNSFTDVTADSAFRPYVEWAYQKGIMQGTDNGRFEPDRVITREEIAVIFANYAKATGFTLPVTRTATIYADTSSIGSSYKTAVTAMQQAGIMMGGTNNKFNPKSSATRAEFSSMLHRYIKLTIDPATAQGWALNDAGQYLYYKDGKALTNTQTIDGVKYYFTTDGIMVSDMWIQIDGMWYYFYGDGKLAKSTTVDGYEVNANGVRIMK